MANELIPGGGSMFQYEGRPLRWGKTESGIFWFVAQDVCDELGIKEARGAIRDFAEDEKGVQTVHTLGGKQAMLVLYEPGLYKLLGRSTKPEAAPFQRWLYHDVVPEIRKTGQYRRKKHEKYVKLGYQTEWIEAREQGVEDRKTFTDTLSEHGVTEKFDYAKCTNAIYVPLLGGGAADVKKARQLPVKASLRDNLSRKELVAIQLSEIVAKETIEEENRTGFPQCYNACKDASTAIAAAANMGRQLPPPQTI